MRALGSGIKQLLWMGGAVMAATTLVAPAFGQIQVYLGAPPPPLRYEVQPPMPGPGYVWNEGYWGNEGGRYRWVRGMWNQPPYQGAYWNHPHYDHYKQGWQMDPGHWDKEDHGNKHDWKGDHGHGDNGRGNDGQNGQGYGNQGNGDQGHGNNGHGH